MGGGLKYKLIKEVDLKASPEESFSVWKHTSHQIPDHTPSNLQAVHLHEGDWKTSGCLKTWKYTVEGKNEVFKEKVEFDEENKVVTLVGVEGDVMKYYKSFKPIFGFAPKAHGQGCLGTVAIEYEKLNESVPTPDKYVDFMSRIVIDIDARIFK
ncbi:Polyketide cyclase/dehydrase and lipid transport superfamily protein [Euphorbia peplus]|nr:Polyketide cyclase/dehydrase and lipid transport superfamily protein [Euphorbia peplus]